jgi:hypothetical protein
MVDTPITSPPQPNLIPTFIAWIIANSLAWSLSALVADTLTSTDSPGWVGVFLLVLIPTTAALQWLALRRHGTWAINYVLRLVGSWLVIIIIIGVCLPFTLFAAVSPILTCFVSLSIALVSVFVLIHLQREPREYPWWVISPSVLGLTGLFFGIIVALSLPDSIPNSLKAAIGSLTLGLSLPILYFRVRTHSSDH